MTLTLAIVAVAIASGTGASLMLWNIAASTTLVVGVMYLFVSWFGGFVHGVIRTNFSHGLGSPVRDLGTPKVRPIFLAPLRVKILAVCANSEPTISRPSLIWRYVSTRSASSVVVVYSVFWCLTALVNRVKRIHCCHTNLPVRLAITAIWQRRHERSKYLCGSG